MTNTRPPGRGSPYHQPPMYPGEQRGYGANLPYGFAGERRPIEPPRRRRSLFGTILLYCCVALLVLGAGAATFFFMSPPTDFIRREIIASVKRETGRDLTIGGGASFTLLPSFGLKLDDVSLSAPPGMDGEPLVRMTSFNVGVQLMPLLRRQIVVDRVELNDPVFSLRVDANGRRSWDMAAADVPAPMDEGLMPARLRFAEAMPGHGLAGLLVSPAAAANGAPVLSLDNILIRNGALRYTDERNGAWGRFDGFNAQFSLPALDRPLTGTGTLVSEGETFQFKSTLTTPSDLAAQRSAQLALTVSGMPLTFSYEGTVGAHEGVGTLSANAPSLSALAHWWGNDVSPDAGAGEVAFTAHLNASPAGVILSAIDLKAGPAAATGTVGFTERAGERPHVAAELAVSGLDIAALPLGANLRAGRSATPAPTPLSLDPAPDMTPRQGGEPNSIDDLLERPGPRVPGAQVKGYTRRAGWSNDPIDIKALGLADADARLTLTNVTYKQTRIDSAKVV
ncbi:MAG TPA: AsmA family protein, partial [Hyphomicrobium sp.]|nr:AsmA family protein [Hyphomicrobium sp.]